MAVIEQLICGRNPENPDGNRTVLSHSPGMGAAVTEEIVRFCGGWGSTPVGGLTWPAVLSLPLKNTMPSIRGQIYAVIRVTTGAPACFHAVVMSKADFRSFNYNPFAVIKAGSFLDSWSGGQRLAQGRIEPVPEDSLFSPPPNPGDVGLVDEALQQFLTKGKLVLNLEAGTAESDRILGLMILVMPTNSKEKLRFASFSTDGENNYMLAAKQVPNTPLASWQRLFMTLIDQGTPETVRKYVASVRNGLAAGTLASVNQKETLKGTRVDAPSPPPKPVLEPVSSNNIPIGKKWLEPVQSVHYKRSTVMSDRVAPAFVPITAFGGSPGQTAANHHSPGRTMGGAAGRPARSPLVRQSIKLNRRNNGKQSHVLLTFIVVSVLLAASWVYLDRSGKGKQWGIFDLANLGTSQAPATKAPSLLEVVDVGAEYSRQLGRIQRSKLLPGADRDQALRLAQADLQADAAGPLLVQADLFLQLADDGIKQGNRPVREKDRLNSLNNQGQVLVEELGRLELAYYSLQTGVLWHDLAELSDTKVSARRDSLMRFAKVRMAAVSKEVGSAPYWRSLRTASKNVSGMSALLTLFQTPTWSEEWENQMKRAAEKVSPTASPMSRAYRNNAFTLVRLKHAEQQEANLLAAYGGEFTRGAWPSLPVKDILPELRRRAGLFSREEIPSLLRGTLALYAHLENPVPLAKEVAVSARAMADIQQNAAVKFDPAVYENYLARIRFEAIGQLLASETDPKDIPVYLTQDLDLAMAVLFHETLQQNENTADWSSLAALAGDSFLGRWSSRQAVLVHSRTALMRESLDQAWLECGILTGNLRERVAAGQDWTSVWVDLQSEIDKIMTSSPATVQGDSVRALKWNQAADLKASLEVPRPLDLKAVVVRLDQDAIEESGSVMVEFQTEQDGQLFNSLPIRMGPAAPEGTGWVGTAELDWVVAVSPNDGFSAKVWVPGRVDPILVVYYPPLSERVGPGALVRPRRAEGGTLAFRIDNNWWGGLQVPKIP